MEYREFKHRDHTRLAQIIQTTWGYERLSANPEVARIMGNIYLYSCLAGQNYHKVAVENGVPVGVIMGNARAKRQKANLVYRLLQLKYCLQMRCHKEGRFVLNLFAGFERMDEEMLRETGKPYDGELVFFVTDPALRGRHIGTTLYQGFLNELQTFGCKQIYVYTDDTCNFGFYEHHGFIRVNQRAFEMRGQCANFYVYEKELTN